MRLFFFLMISGFGQMALSQSGDDKFQGREKQYLFSYSNYKTISVDPFAFHLVSGTHQTKVFPLKALPVLNHLPGMFCKMEYKLEAKSKLAPRFRLGSLNYTEWMEGKKGFEVRYWK